MDSVLMMPSLGYYDHSLRAGNDDLVVGEWNDAPVPAGVVGFKDPAGFGAAADGPPPTALIQRLARGGTARCGWSWAKPRSARANSPPSAGRARIAA